MLPGLLLTALLAFQQAPPSPPAPPPTRGTAILRGQITDAETGVPIPRAIITARLHVPGSTGMIIQNVADHEGRFELLNLASGGYQVSATAGEHRASHVREPYPAASPSGATAAVMLGDGEVKSNINIALRRSLAISGRVVDEFGDPLVRVTVQVSAASGRPYASQQSRITDDRGMFRVFGLASGRYVVCAQIHQRHPSRNTTIAIADQFVSTCHPSALEEADAQAVTLSSSDVEGIEIRMRRRRLLSISGIAIDSTGAVAQSAAITFHRFERTGSSSGTTNSSEGQFRFTGLVPGDYAVEASLGGVTTAGAPSTAVKERAYVPVTLVEDHVTDLIVPMKPLAKVQGRLVFEDGPPPAGSVSPMEVAAWPETGRFHVAIRPARVENDFTFTLNDLSGRIRLALQWPPRGWVVKSIRYKGIDIRETAAEFVTDSAQPVEIVLTTRLAGVSGSVTDDSGRPAAGACVVLLSTAPAQPIGAMFGPTPMAVGSRDGRFTLPGVAAGEYMVAAIPCPQYDALRQRRATNDVLLKHAERVTLVDNDRLTMNLRLVTLPER